MGASIALAGASRLEHSRRKIVRTSVRLRKSSRKALWFATALTLGGLATECSSEPDGTADQGGGTKSTRQPEFDSFSQAAVLTLYDPDRSQVVTLATPNGRDVSTWDLFFGEAVAALDKHRSTKGAGLRILSETVSSPTLARQRENFLAAFPAAKWHQYEPWAHDNALLGARMAFGEDVATRYEVDKANVIVSLDADFLAPRPGNLRAARQFAARREPASMNRLYVVEPMPTVTGGMADHRLPLRAQQVAGFAQELGQRLAGPPTVGSSSGFTDEQGRWLDALTRDLKKNEGRA